MKYTSRRTLWLSASLFGVIVWVALTNHLGAQFRQAAKWNADPNTVVVRVVELRSLIPPQEVVSYIPEMQIWGDGRIVWVEHPAYNARRVLGGKLTSAQMTALLHGISAAGFWKWQALYRNQNVVDGTARCIIVQLAGDNAAKDVCEVNGDAPFAFYWLYRWLTSGAGVSGVPYVPEAAYVVAWSFLPCPTGETISVWPHATLGMAVSAVVDETWPSGETGAAVDGHLIRGQGLAQLWQIANASSSYTFMVQDEGTCYGVALQIPGLTWNSLSERTPTPTTWPVSPLATPVTPLPSETASVQPTASRTSQTSSENQHWQIEIVDSNGVNNGSLVLDQQGVPHISY